ncbi:hypothetical protein M514_20950, partial [Trichuris suis]
GAPRRKGLHRHKPLRCPTRFQTIRRRYFRHHQRGERRNFPGTLKQSLLYEDKINHGEGNERLGSGVL